MPKIEQSTKSDWRYDLEPWTEMAYCTAIIDMWTQPWSVQYPAPKRKVKIAFEVPNQMYTNQDGVECPKIIYANYTLSTAEKATFRPVFEALYQWTPDTDDYYAINFDKLVWSACSITLERKGDYVNVTQVAKLPKGVNLSVSMHNTPFTFDLDSFDQKKFDSLGEKIKEKIITSPEYQKATWEDPKF